VIASEKFKLNKRGHMLVSEAWLKDLKANPGISGWRRVRTIKSDIKISKIPKGSKK
jgi:hypothetical protein